MKINEEVEWDSFLGAYKWDTQSSGIARKDLSNHCLLENGEKGGDKYDFTMNTFVSTKQYPHN